MNEIICPICSAPEAHSSGMIHIRGNKVHSNNSWHSQCLVCSGGYDKPFGKFTEENHDPKKGWFKTN